MCVAAYSRRNSPSTTGAPSLSKALVPVFGEGTLATIRSRLLFSEITFFVEIVVVVVVVVTADTVDVDGVVDVVVNDDDNDDPDDVDVAATDSLTGEIRGEEMRAFSSDRRV